MVNMHAGGANFLVLSIKIVYHPGKDNRHTDALSHSPVLQSVASSEECTSAQTHVDVIHSDQISRIQQLLQADPVSTCSFVNFAAEQSRDPFILQLVQYLSDGKFPQNEQQPIAS